MNIKILSPRTIEAVHKKKISLVKINNNINIIRDNIGLSGKYYDTG